MRGAIFAMVKIPQFILKKQDKNLMEGKKFVRS